MGNKMCYKNSVSPEGGNNTTNGNNINLSEKTKTRVLMITTLCCSTIVNTSEPVVVKKVPTKKTKVKQLKAPKVANVNPNRPMNSKARVRRYGYQFAKVSPIVISDEEEEEPIEIEKPDVETCQYEDKDDETEEALDEYPEAPKVAKSQSMENLYVPERNSENVINEEERKRCRSAMLQKVQKNEIVRKKKNELRLLQAKLKRQQEKQKFQNSKQ